MKDSEGDDGLIADFLLILFSWDLVQAHFSFLYKLDCQFFVL